MPTLRRRRLRTLTVFLLLGAIVNIAVAWGCAMWSPLGRGANVGMAYRDGAETYWFDVGCVGGFGVDRLEVAATFASNIHPDANGTIRYFPSLHFNQQAVLATADTPRWSRLGIWRGGDQTAVIESEHTSGWPARALWCSIIESKGSTNNSASWVERVDTDSAIAFTSIPVIAEDLISARRLPLCPIWPGFAINSIFYALILWLLPAAPFAIRRRLRVRRGPCPHCAYPVGTSEVCTECGNQLAIPGVGPDA